MEIFHQFSGLFGADYTEIMLLFWEQLYWLLAFFIAALCGDVETLMKIVYDDKRRLPKHAHTLAGRATLWIIRRYVAHRYMTYRIYRDTSTNFRHCLYDIWLLLPELRHEVDVVRKEFGPLRSIA